MNQLGILFLAIPLLASLLIMIVGWMKPKLAHPMTVVTMGATLLATIKLFQRISEVGSIQYKMGDWKPPIGIEFLIDPLNAMVILLVAFVAFCVSIYAKKSVEKEMPGKEPLVYTLFTLLVTGLLGISATGDAFNLYVLIEVSALTSYALLALRGGRGYMSTFQYLIMSTIGACFYLLGVGYILIKTGSLNMNDINSFLPSLANSQAILIAFTLITVGIWVKMSLFPFHGWLSNVYTNAPTVTTCLAAPLMTKVYVYVMIRMMYSVFSADYVFGLNWQPVVMWMAVAAIVVGALYALAQKDVKRLFTFLVISEIGYLVGGAWLGNKAGLTGAIYHISADGLMTAALFMSLGAFTYYSGSTQLSALKGIFKKMPATTVAFLIVAFSMIGIPPTAGFFSKWYLLTGAYQAGAYHFMIALLASSLINAILFFKIIEVGYFGATPDEKPVPSIEAERKQEAPFSMVASLMAVSLSILVLGFYSKEVVEFIDLFLVIKGF